jgi:RNase P subunit RPR2
MRGCKKGFSKRVKRRMKKAIKEFLETWTKREAGQLPPPDLRVFCEVCGAPVLPGESAGYDRRGIVCKSCFQGKSEKK